MGPMGHIKDFVEHHYRHFNAATLRDAARAYVAHLDAGGRMLATLAGAMSTAEIGLSLAEMIRQGKVHGISCTGANLEEDLFNLVAHDHYERVPGYRNLRIEDEVGLLGRHMNRVTDTCIPEAEAMRRIERHVKELWIEWSRSGRRFFPEEPLYELLRSGVLKGSYQIDPRDSWLATAAERNLPIFVPGWEDSTLGNFFSAAVIRGEVRDPTALKNGIEGFVRLAEWYETTARSSRGVGFFQIGGGIAGDFPVCVVPMLHQDLERHDTPVWSYFCQISDSTTSYGSYSGANPSEKITWGKLGSETPQFSIESDATIVAPLLFAYVLDW